MPLLCCKQFYASLDKSVRLEMLLCSWKRFYASLDGSVRLEMLLCSWKRFYVSLDESVRLEVLLRSWKGFCASFGCVCVTRNALTQLETILCKFGRICATGNALYASVQQKSSWKWFYKGLDKSVWQVTRSLMGLRTLTILGFPWHGASGSCLLSSGLYKGGRAK